MEMAVCARLRNVVPAVNQPNRMIPVVKHERRWRVCSFPCKFPSNDTIRWLRVSVAMACNRDPINKFVRDISDVEKSLKLSTHQLALLVRVDMVPKFEQRIHIIQFDISFL
jgi:hypothetical protein